MRSILIINVPEDFDYRRCSIGGDGNIYYEREGEQRTSIIGNIKNLKPLPNYEKETGYQYSGNPDELMSYNTGLVNGYNACLDRILGETKWN